jgi:tetratricopeptide (TPR) repeat protein
VRDLTREAGIALLDRAAEIGLLTAFGHGYYGVHPALPWYLKRLFEQYYPSAAAGTPQNPQLAATRAFAEAMGWVARSYEDLYQSRDQMWIDVLAAEEANLLYGRRLAQVNGWWEALTNTMLGLHTLYGRSGRWAEWARLVEEVVPAFVDREADGPRADREWSWWAQVTNYRVEIALEARRLAEAERLQRLLVDGLREHAGPASAGPPDSLTDVEREAIGVLAASLEMLARILRERGNPDCAAVFKEAVALSQRAGDRALEASVAFNLGRAYQDIPDLHDLRQAFDCFRQSLELREEHDLVGRGISLDQLGTVAYGLYWAGRAAGLPDEESRFQLAAARGFCEQALELFPEGARDHVAVVHLNLGGVCSAEGDLDAALTHWREAIRNFEATGNLRGAGTARVNAATVLARADRLPDALSWAKAALRTLEASGEEDELLRFARSQVAAIEQRLGTQGGD